MPQCEQGSRAASGRFCLCHVERLVLTAALPHRLPRIKEQCAVSVGEAWGYPTSGPVETGAAGPKANCLSPGSVQNIHVGRLVSGKLLSGICGRATGVRQHTMRVPTPCCLTETQPALTLSDPRLGPISSGHVHCRWAANAVWHLSASPLLHLVLCIVSALYNLHCGV